MAAIGAEKVKELLWFHPKDPILTLDPSIKPELLFDDILELYNAYRKPVTFLPEDLLESYRKVVSEETLTNVIHEPIDSLAIGSNNWVVSGNLMEDGNTYMANDPHRTIAVPSLRYMAHLVAPGWNVIGGGEPEIPGISIGHNGHGAWGLTVFRTDGEDLYVYDLHPENNNQYFYKGEWREMTTILERIPIKGKNDTIVSLHYTHHGPVSYLDEKNRKAYAIRCAWLEPGGSPYLASLRMDQATTWKEFRDACNYSHIPGENMVWADSQGNIGWQAVGIAPVRNNFSGLVPVPGDGRYEWDGYLPIIKKPNDFNPEKGYIATANQNVTPNSYEHWNAIGYSWSDPYRGNRVNEVLSQGKKMTMNDMKALQVDYTSLPAMQLVPLIEPIEFSGKAAEAKAMLLKWNHILDPNSIEAAIYTTWEEEMWTACEKRFIPDAAKPYITSIQLKTLIDWLTTPNKKFGPQPTQARDLLVREAFENAISILENKLGPDLTKWQYGQPNLKHTYMGHALGNAVNDSLKEQLNLGPLPRGGNGYTPGSTGNALQQRSGASFRMIVNTGDWDATLGTNGPGQSGDPESPLYKNLFESWAKDQFFPVYYSKKKIDSVAIERLILKPNPF